MKKTGLAVGLALLVGVLLRLCVITSFHIPSEGMENTLLRGERILVNRWSYGWRLPFIGLWGYHRWAEKEVRKGDVIVFNNPAHHPSSTAIDQRDVFIGRCVGLPGETLWMDTLFTVVLPPVQSPDRKLLYTYPTHKYQHLKKLIEELQVQAELPTPGKDTTGICSISPYELYILQQALPADSCWLLPLQQAEKHLSTFPFVVPRKGQTVSITPQNRTLLCNTLLLHEQQRAHLKNDTLFLNGKPIQSYTFRKSYHWVMSDNASNLQDSRLFGLIPTDHLIGRATYIWYSADRKRIGEKIY